MAKKRIPLTVLEQVLKTRGMGPPRCCPVVADKKEKEEVSEGTVFYKVPLNLRRLLCLSISLQKLSRDTKPGPDMEDFRRTEDSDAVEALLKNHIRTLGGHGPSTNIDFHPRWKYSVLKI